ncbi:hypothetical protein Gpo141_00014031 [Globisporangium polare]
MVGCGARQASAASARRAPVRRVYCSAPSGAPAAPVKKKEVSLAMGLAAGGFAGVLSALSGVGGGMVLIPAVAKMTNFSMQTVNGTCLGGLTAGAAVGAYNYSQADACNYPLALLTSIPAIAFARVGVRAAHRVSSKTLSTIVGCGMLASVPFIVLKNSEFLKQLEAKAAESAHLKKAADKPANPLDLQYYHTSPKKSEGGNSEEPLRVVPQPKNDAALLEAITKDPLAFAVANLRYVAVGAFAGFISGLCGIGGTMVTTTYLTAGTDMPQAVVIGTTLVSVLPMAMSANYYNYKSKSIHVPTALKIGGSLVVGVYCTSKFILEYQKVPEDFLRAVLATAIGAASIAMIRRPV